MPALGPGFSAGFVALTTVAQVGRQPRLRVLAGVEARSFDASAYRPRTTLIAEGGVSYTPSGLTTLSVTSGV